MSQFYRHHPEALINQTIKKTYQFLKILGTGTFAIVYQCMNLQTRQKVAVKVAVGRQGQKMLNFQKKIYRMLTQTYSNGDKMQIGFAKYLQYGKTDKYSYIVFQKLSVSLEDIFVKVNHKFSVKTVLNIGIQALQLIEKLHKIGYVHRDIKPGNFLLGHGNKKDKIYLIDFGLVRKIRKQEDEGDRKSFIGTKRFASVASHLGMEQSQKDDLQSLGYTLIYFLKGRLPWQGINLASEAKKYERIGQIKQQINFEDLCKIQVKGEISYGGEPFLKMFRYIKALSFGQVPNYECLKKIFMDELKMIQNKNMTTINGFNRWKCKDKFDWMDQQSQSRKGSHSVSSNNKQKQKERRRNASLKSAQKHKYFN